MFQVLVIFGVLFFTPSSAYVRRNLRDYGSEYGMHNQVETVREKFETYRDVWSVPENQITWDPELSNNPFLTEMCQHNQDGNYQIPDNCQQFCMCAGGQAYLWTCPGGGLYAPLPDECVYDVAPDQEVCPWKSIWTYPNGVHCDTLGQKQFWGNLTFPAERDVFCGDDIVYCANYRQVGAGKCDPGFGYSKCFLACIRQDVCFRTDLSCYSGYPYPIA